MTEKPSANRTIAPQQQSEDKRLAAVIRPQRLDEFIGQEKLKTNLAILTEAAQVREEPLDHVLFHGPPGERMTLLIKSFPVLDRFGVRKGQWRRHQPVVVEEDRRFAVLARTDRGRTVRRQPCSGKSV